MVLTDDDAPIGGGGESEEGAGSALLAAASRVLARELAAPLAPGLHIVATPIGNLADFSLRAIAVLARADHICCEDTRHSQKLLSAYDIRARLTPYHDHNAASQRPKILEWLSAGKAVALISDAGTPLIADPGYKLVRAALEEGHRVYAVPGPSAAIAALSVSGLPTDAFHFAGFLPPKQGARRRRLEALAEIDATLVLYETAQRLEPALGDLALAMSGREIVIVREITKRFEEMKRGVLPLDLHGADVKGELVLLIGPPIAADMPGDAIADALTDALQRLSLRDAVEEVTRTLRVPRREVYSLALKLQKE
jgi:16S rRNA (cytidine1402-2'-O)-methyltransferase